MVEKNPIVFRSVLKLVFDSAFLKISVSALDFWSDSSLRLNKLFSTSFRNLFLLTTVFCGEFPAFFWCQRLCVRAFYRYRKSCSTRIIQAIISGVSNL